MKALTIQPGKKTSLLFLTLIFTFLNTQIAIGQLSVVLDSLKTQLITATDTTKADLFLNISEKFVKSSKLDSALKYAQKGLDFSKKITYLKGEAIALDVLAMVSFYQGDMDKTLEFNKKSIEVWRKTTNKRGLSTSLHNLGRTFYYLNIYEEALENFFKSAAIDEAIDDETGLATSYMNIGIVQNRMGRDSLALEFLLSAVELAERSGDEYTHLAALVNLAGQYEKADDFDNSMIHAQKAYDISEQMGIPMGIIKSSSSLANAYLHKKDYEEALRYADIVLDSETKSDESRSYAYRVKATAYEETGNLKLATAFGEKGLAAAEKSGVAPAILGCQKKLFEINKKSGNFKKALEYNEAYHTFNDSLFNIEKNEQINKLTAEFDTERKQKQIEDLQKEAQLTTLRIRQKNGLLVFLSFFTLAVIAAVYFYNQRKLSEEKRKTLLMQQKLLRTQMNPHFIFNALSAIQNFFFEKDDGPKAAFYLSKFAKLMRLILENSREDYIQLDQEIATLENYLNLQKVRFNDNFEFSIECDPGLNQEITSVPPMLAQPFIENSLEHGLLHKEEAGKVKIRFEKIEDILEFTIEDNGIGREKAGKMENKENREHESMATRITEDRLTVLNRKLKRKAKLIIADVLDKNREIAGTKVTIQIPLMMA